MDLARSLIGEQPTDYTREENLQSGAVILHVHKTPVAAIINGVGFKTPLCSAKVDDWFKKHGIGSSKNVSLDFIDSIE